MDDASTYQLIGGGVDTRCISKGIWGREGDICVSEKDVCIFKKGIYISEKDILWPYMNFSIDKFSFDEILQYLEAHLKTFRFRM